MIRRPPRSTQSRSSAASDVYKRQIESSVLDELVVCDTIPLRGECSKIKVISTDELFAVTIRNAFENKSINSLFMLSLIHISEPTRPY